MYVAEIGLRRLFRSPILESVEEMIDVKDIKRRALSGEKPYDYFGVSLGINPSVGEINSFVYTYCFKRGMYNQELIEDLIAQVAAAVAIKESEKLELHQYYLDLI
mgnify:FL=1